MILFNYGINCIIDSVPKHQSRIVLGQIAGFLQSLTDLNFAGNTTLLEYSAHGLQSMNYGVSEVSKRIGLTSVAPKVKFLLSTNLLLVKHQVIRYCNAI